MKKMKEQQIAQLELHNNERSPKKQGIQRQETRDEFFMRLHTTGKKGDGYSDFSESVSSKSDKLKSPKGKQTSNRLYELSKELEAKK